MRRSRRSQIARHRNESGDTMVEVLLALVIMGLTIASALAAFATTLSATTEHRTLATNDTVLRSFVETATYDLRLQPMPAFVPCATTSYYQTSTSIVTNFVSNLPKRDHVSKVTLVVVGYEGPGCQSTPSQNPPSPLPADPPAQLLKATVTSSGGSDSLQFVAMDPDATGSSGSYSISPTSGPAQVRTPMTIQASGGLNFSQASSVNFVPTTGGASTHVMSFTVSPDGLTITLNAPLEASNNFQVYVTVTLPSGDTTPNAANLFSYAPSITAVNVPTSGPTGGGTPVTITGNGFTATSTVMFGSVASPTVTYTGSSTSLQAVSPAGAAGTVDVTVTSEFGTSPITQPDDQFTYTSGLAVTSVTPSSGPSAGGNSVTIGGSGFANVTAVHFGTALLPATDYTVNPNQTSIVVNPLPAGSGTVDVTVTAGGVTSAINRPADQYTYTVDEPTGIAVVLKSGTNAPVVACGSGSGNGSCKIPVAGTCAITGASTTPTMPPCSVTGLKNNGSATFFVALVDSSGNPVAFSPGASSSIALTNACATDSPGKTCVNSMTIPSGASTTSDTLTASYNGNKGVTVEIVLTSGSSTFSLTLDAAP